VTESRMFIAGRIIRAVIEPMRDLAGLAGGACLVRGVAMYSQPMAWIVGGALLMGAVMLHARQAG
jgi:hypothetical protein